MAKVLGRDYTAGSLGDNATGTDRSTIATVTDFEGLVKTCLAEENRMAGLRRGANLFPYSEDFTNAAWSKNNTSLTAGVSDPFGGTDAYTLTADAANGHIYEPTTSTSGNAYVFTIWVRRRTGTGTIYMRNLGSNTNETLTIDGTWTRYERSTSSAGANIYPLIQIVTSGDEIDIYGAQLEDVTGQTNQNPGDYVSAGVPTNIKSYYNDFTGHKNGWVDFSQATSTLSGSGTLDIVRGSGTGRAGIVLSDNTADAGKTYKIRVRARLVSGGNVIPTIENASGSLLAVGTALGSSFEIQELEAVHDGTTSLRGIINLGSPTGTEAEVDWYESYSPDHGAGVDAVKYFNYENPNTVSSNVVNPTGATATPITGGYLLLEPAATNKILYSESFDDSTWVKDTNRVSITSDDIVAPTGEGTADKVTEGTLTGGHRVYSGIRTLSNTNEHTVSLFVKDVDRRYFGLRGSASSPYAWAVFDLTDETVDTNSEVSAATIEQLGTTGWYRCTMTYSPATTSERMIINFLDTGTAPSTSTVSYSYTGSSKSMYFFGAQLEEGGPTSYISNPSNTETTRNADTKISYPLTTPQSAGMAVLGVDGFIENSSGTNLVNFSSSSNYGPMYLHDATTVRSYDGTSTLNETLTNTDSVEYIASMWGSSGRDLSHYSNSQWQTWATTASYDNTFDSLNELNIGSKGVIARPFKIKSIDIYDTDEGTSWIESNYPAPAATADTFFLPASSALAKAMRGMPV